MTVVPTATTAAFMVFGGFYAAQELTGNLLRQQHCWAQCFQSQIHLNYGILEYFLYLTPLSSLCFAVEKALM